MYNLGFFLFFLENLSSQYLGRKYVEMHVALHLHCIFSAKNELSFLLDDVVLFRKLFINLIRISSNWIMDLPEKV